MRNRLPWLWLALLIVTVSSVSGCASSFEPRSLEEINFQERSQTQVDGNLRVTAAVLSAEETEAVFGFALYKKGIQPIWLEIENKIDKPTWFLPFSPSLFRSPASGLITMRLTGRTFTPKLKLSIMTRPDSERPWKSCRLGVKRNRPSTFGGLLIADESRPAASRKFGISRYSYVFTPCQTGSSTL